MFAPQIQALDSQCNGERLPQPATSTAVWVQVCLSAQHEAAPPSFQRSPFGFLHTRNAGSRRRTCSELSAAWFVFLEPRESNFAFMNSPRSYPTSPSCGFRWLLRCSGTTAANLQRAERGAGGVLVGSKRAERSADGMLLLERRQCKSPCITAHLQRAEGGANRVLVAVVSILALQRAPHEDGDHEEEAEAAQLPQVARNQHRPLDPRPQLL